MVCRTTGTDNSCHRNNIDFGSSPLSYSPSHKVWVKMVATATAATIKIPKTFPKATNHKIVKKRQSLSFQF